ncbi:chemotaxis protein CheW [Fictibacillus aquaticus]|uniref:Chemotaxis protein CheA n=1 Tax=Fictibacillus aquaticus TaxID=2021314 RepID=A0A235FD05_9BACL|nr:chemotaxis protein CheA [Fictibacillus aquaticus]OYD58837.1 chemotaxis protein CheA [Fictibacillus aquaticus]
MEMTQYLDIFLDESREHLQSINTQLLLLESNPEELSIVNEIFRSAHTLKGMSATMGFADLASLTHVMENLLDAIRNKRAEATPEVLDALFSSIDHLENMVASIGSGGEGKRDVSETVALLELLETGQQAPGDNKNSHAESGLEYDDYEKTIISESVEQGFQVFEIMVTLEAECLLKAARVYMVFNSLETNGDIIKANPPIEQLEAEQFNDTFTIVLLTNAEAESIRKNISSISEVKSVNVKLALPHAEKSGVSIPGPAREEAAENIPVAAEKSTASSSAGSKTIRVNIDRLNDLMNLFEELVIERGRLEQLSRGIKKQELTETVERMSRTSADLQDIILKLRMVAVESVFNRFPRMIRGLAKDLGKKVNLEISGAETELDRTFIDEIGDPLVHLLRNSLDHGIEKPSERIAAGKNETGTIHLRAYHSGNLVFIEIEDDGGGINRDKVLQKALENGLISQVAADSMTDQQIYALLFASGFSTADTVSDISGRGVGLDVVKNKIESLGGSITVDSSRGKGTTFSIQLPLTLSILKALLVKVHNEKYAIPLSSIIETAVVESDQIQSLHGQDVLQYRGKVVPLIYLEETFNIPSKDGCREERYIVLVRRGDKTVGLAVDSFIGQQEIVLKSLGSYLSASVHAISGAAILGDGEVALVVDSSALIK